MIKFEKVSAYAAADFNLPMRKTKGAAGYDFEVIEDITIPSYHDLLYKLGHYQGIVEVPVKGFSLADVAALSKDTKAKPTLVPTGVKCQLNPGYYLELSVRSSTPLKYWLILANGVGIIDADYWNNEDNEGHIFFQIINLSPFPIQLKRGDIIGQGIIKQYEVTDDDLVEGIRVGGFGSTTPSEEQLDEIIIPPITEEEMKQAYEKTFECQVNNLKQAFNDFANVALGFGESTNKQQSIARGFIYE